MDWAPRIVRDRERRVDEARRQIEQEFGRPATSDEIAGRLGVEQDEFDKIERDSKAVSTISITRKLTQSDGSQEVREIDVARDDGADNPLRLMQRKDLQDLVTKGLSRAERLIVVLYYYEGMTMKEIGATLDLSESRVSQMHSSILQRLKAQMQHRSRELEPVQ
jgi:RNA polymerase sigma factor for flagellar operon FliA